MISYSLLFRDCIQSPIRLSVKNETNKRSSIRSIHAQKVNLQLRPMISGFVLNDFLVITATKGYTSPYILRMIHYCFIILS